MIRGGGTETYEVGWVVVRSIGCEEDVAGNDTGQTSNTDLNGDAHGALQIEK